MSAAVISGSTGEDISSSHPGAIYLDIVNEADLPGVAFETAAVTFVFEFGEYLHMLDRLAWSQGLRSAYRGIAVNYCRLSALKWLR